MEDELAAARYEIEQRKLAADADSSTHARAQVEFERTQLDATSERVAATNAKSAGQAFSRQVDDLTRELESAHQLNAVIRSENATHRPRIVDLELVALASKGGAAQGSSQHDQAQIRSLQATVAQLQAELAAREEELIARSQKLHAALEKLGAHEVGALTQQAKQLEATRQAELRQQRLAAAPRQQAKDLRAVLGSHKSGRKVNPDAPKVYSSLEPGRAVVGSRGSGYTPSVRSPK